MPSLLSLSNEVIVEILKHLRPLLQIQDSQPVSLWNQTRNLRDNHPQELRNVALTCQHLNAIATPILYSNLSFTPLGAKGHGSLSLLLRTLTDNSNSAGYIRKVKFGNQGRGVTFPDLKCFFAAPNIDAIPIHRYNDDEEASISPLDSCVGQSTVEHLYLGDSDAIYADLAALIISLPKCLKTLFFEVCEVRWTGYSPYALSGRSWIEFDLRAEIEQALSLHQNSLERLVLTRPDHKHASVPEVPLDLRNFTCLTRLSVYSTLIVPKGRDLPLCIWLPPKLSYLEIIFDEPGSFQLTRRGKDSDTSPLWLYRLLETKPKSMLSLKFIRIISFDKSLPVGLNELLSISGTDEDMDILDAADLAGVNLSIWMRHNKRIRYVAEGSEIEDMWEETFRLQVHGITLETAIEGNHLGTIREILDCIPAPSQNELDQSLTKAIRHDGSFEAINLLLSHGAHLTRNGFSGAFHGRQDTTLFQILIDHGCWDINSLKYQESALMEVGPNLACVKWLVARGAQISLRLRNPFRMQVGANRNVSALEKLAQYSLEEAQPAMEFLIEQGAEIRPEALLSTMNCRGPRTPRLPVLKFLIDKGADINGIDERYGTPLHYAVYYHKPDAVKFLLESGADRTIICHGHTAQKSAKEKKYKDVIAVFT